jgi:hypothetical protein
MEPPGTELPPEAAGEPQPRLRKRRSRPGSEAIEPHLRPGLFVPWLRWIQDQPLLAAAVLVFCLTAIGGLVVSLPTGFWSAGRSTSVADPAPSSVPEPLASDPRPRGPAPPADPAPASEPAAPGSWVLKPESAPSPRGLALAYAYRTRPPGGDSRFDWFVQIKGARSLLEEVDQVVWRMDPPPKNDGGDLVSRNRANDGFPLFGDGPGGWFGVTATVQYRDGSEETLSRRIELPD